MSRDLGTGLHNVDVHRLVVHEDARGWLAETLRPDHLAARKEFGQIHITTAHPGFVKGNHYHTRKHEWFCVIKGTGLLALEDIDTASRRELMIGDGNFVTVHIPPRVAHGIKNVGTDMMFLLVYNEETFDRADPDTFPKQVI